jgi:hypothetical protein
MGPPSDTVEDRQRFVSTQWLRRGRSFTAAESALSAMP